MKIVFLGRDHISLWKPYSFDQVCKGLEGFLFRKKLNEITSKLPQILKLKIYQRFSLASPFTISSNFKEIKLSLV